ncbi:protein JINGUBANG-like [Vicia villosa]|uniref:protein JINGUBANG-like n=1 Tax=Vicia villosa TaxID=3911 RepID=UPI00273A9BA8|nr:protein JINGUBANG-like [Vicia villosa]
MEYQISFSSDSNNLQKEFATTRSFSSQHSLASVPSLNSNSNSNSQFLNSSFTCITTLKLHTYISSLTLAGNFLYTGSSSKEITSWNITHFHSHPQESINTIVSGNGAVKSIVIHSDRLFTAHQDNKIRIWKITITNDGELQQQHKFTRLATLPTFTNRFTSILNPKNHVKIRFRRHKKCTWIHHVDTVSSLALSKDGTLLYSVSWDRTIKVWKTKDLTCLESVQTAHDDAINAITVSNDGYVYTGSADKKIKVWKKEKGDKNHSLIDTLEKHRSGVNALALNSDGSVLYSGACDRSILVYKRGENGNLVVMGALRGHTKSILCLAVVSDLVCSGSEDKTIRIWRSNSNNVDREYCCLGVLEGHRGPIKCLIAVFDQFDEQSSEATFLIYSGSLDCDVKVWKMFLPLL